MVDYPTNIRVSAYWKLRKKVFRLFGRVASRMLTFAEQQRTISRQISGLKAGESLPDIYDERKEIEAWEKYLRQSQDPTTHTYVLNYRMSDEVAALIEKGAKKVINFGVSCAFVDHELAQRFPEVSLVGVDRSPKTKELNERHFAAPNLRFVAADIREYLAEEDATESVFVHVRTATFLLPTAISEVYRAAAASGCRYVLGMEPVGWSEQLQGFYQFSDAPQDSVVVRGAFFIHNYPALLKEAGFEVRRFDLLEYPHPSPDMRNLRFIAQR